MSIGLSGVMVISMLWCGGCISMPGYINAGVNMLSKAGSGVSLVVCLMIYPCCLL